MKGRTKAVEGQWQGSGNTVGRSLEGQWKCSGRAVARAVGRHLRRSSVSGFQLGLPRVPMVPNTPSVSHRRQRRDCHSADTPSPSRSEQLRGGRGGARQNDGIALPAAATFRRQKEEQVAEAQRWLVPISSHTEQGLFDGSSRQHHYYHHHHHHHQQETAAGSRQQNEQQQQVAGGRNQQQAAAGGGRMQQQAAAGSRQMEAAAASSSISSTQCVASDTRQRRRTRSTSPSSRRREFCHSAAPPSAFSRCLNRDGGRGCQQNDRILADG